MNIPLATIIMDHSFLNPKYLSIGGLIYAVMSLLWLVISFFLNLTMSSVLLVFISLLIIGLCIASITILKRSLNFTIPSSNSPKLGMWFGVIFAAEGFLIGTGSGILAISELTIWIVPWVAIVVGGHFFPLGFILDLKEDYLIGGFIIAMVIFSCTSLNESKWSFVVGISTSLFLCFAGWVRIYKANRFIKNISSSDKLV